MSATLKTGINRVLQRFGFEIRRTGTTEIDVFALQRKLMGNKAPCVFDIGAHVGGVTSTYRDHFPNASIYCFEPFPDAFQRLQINTQSDTGIQCFEVAISDSQGTAVFNANQSSATNSLLSTDERGASFWGAGLLQTDKQLEVKTTTVDAFCAEHNIEQIDILKLDVQGAEFAVLKGAEGLLANQQVSLIYTELILCPTYKGQHQFHEYLSYLDSLGYEFVDFFNPVRRRNQLIQADMVFLSKGFNS